jgi:hypothetical protein
MKTVKLIDSTFSHNNAIGYAGENTGRHPKHFQWDTTPGEADIKVWTDIRLREVYDEIRECRHCYNVALLVEPRVVAEKSYDTLLGMYGDFDTVLTHDSDIISCVYNSKFYPFGGSWIKEWGVFPKHQLVSMVVGEKTNTKGQRLRHEVAERFKSKLDLFGKPYTDYLPRKAPMLKPYYYSVVIENCRQNWFFSEKLIDCLSQGTIPIYWGCPDIGRFFDERGILTFQDADELEEILMGATISRYSYLRNIVRDNMEEARRYACAEDSIGKHHPGLLG